MTKQTLKTTAIVVALALVLYWLFRRPVSAPAMQITGPTYPDYRQPNNDPAKYNLYYQVTPGISDLQEILTGGPTFTYVDNTTIQPQVTEQVINAEFNAPALNTLTNQFMPLYGFVGVAAA